MDDVTQYQGTWTVLFLWVHRLIWKLGYVAMRPSDLGYGSQVGSFAAHGSCAPLYRHVPRLLIHVGCMWMINIHQGPMIAEAHSSQCILGCEVSWWMAPFLGSSLLSHVNRFSKINDCFLNVLNHFPQHMFCCHGLKACQIHAFAQLPAGLGLQSTQTVI